MGIFDLNVMSEMGNNTSKVFNNGIAGKVENVKVSVTKKQAGESEMHPDYKVIYTDQGGSELGDGFYYNRVENTNNLDEETFNKKAQGYISRILSIANTVVPDGFKYPDVSDKQPKEVMDILFQIIRDNNEGKLVNIFATYGTKDYPSMYLKVRYFNFIEKADNVGYSGLKEKGDDMMERMVSDAPKQETAESEVKVNKPSW